MRSTLTDRGPIAAAMATSTSMRTGSDRPEAQHEIERLDLDGAEAHVDRDDELDAGAAFELEPGAGLPARAELERRVHLDAGQDRLDEAVALREVDDEPAALDLRRHQRLAARASVPFHVARDARPRRRASSPRAAVPAAWPRSTIGLAVSSPFTPERDVDAHLLAAAAARRRRAEASCVASMSATNRALAETARRNGGESGYVRSKSCVAGKRRFATSPGGVVAGFTRNVNRYASRMAGCPGAVIRSTGKSSPSRNRATCGRSASPSNPGVPQP